MERLHACALYGIEGVAEFAAAKRKVSAVNRASLKRQAKG